MVEASETRIANGIALSQLTVGDLRANCYLLAAPGGEAAIVDPGEEAGRIEAAVDARSLRPTAIVATHAHPDHVSAAARLVERYGAPFCMHPADTAILRRLNFFRFVVDDAPVEIPSVDRPLQDGTQLSIGNAEISIVHAPGHTPGSICLDLGGALLTGDVAIEDRPGRTDPPWGEPAALEASISRLRSRFPTETRLHPGHGSPMRLADVRP